LPSNSQRDKETEVLSVVEDAKTIAALPLLAVLPVILTLFMFTVYLAVPSNPNAAPD
jgi:hypothetical protein